MINHWNTPKIHCYIACCIQSFLPFVFDNRCITKCFSCFVIKCCVVEVGNARKILVCGIIQIPETIKPKK